MIHQLASSCFNVRLTPIINHGSLSDDKPSRFGDVLELRDYLSSGRLASTFLCQASSSSYPLVAKVINLEAFPAETRPELKSLEWTQDEAIQAAYNELDVYAHLVGIQGSTIPRLTGAYRGMRSAQGFAAEIIVIVMEHVGRELQLSTLTDEQRCVVVVWPSENRA